MKRILNWNWKGDGLEAELKGVKYTINFAELDICDRSILYAHRPHSLWVIIPNDGNDGMETIHLECNADKVKNLIDIAETIAQRVIITKDEHDLDRK